VLCGCPPARCGGLGGLVAYPTAPAGSFVGGLDSWPRGSGDSLEPGLDCEPGPHIPVRWNVRPLRRPCLFVRMSPAADQTRTYRSGSAGEAQAPALIRGQGPPGRTIPAGAVPGRVVPRSGVPAEGAPREAVPDDAVPDDAIPDDAVPDDPAPDDAVPDDALEPGIAGD